MRTFLTNAICPKCGNFLKTSDIEGYGFVCDDCDENFYSIETNVPFDDYFEISVKMTADKYKKHKEKLRELVEKYDCDFLGFDEFFSQLDNIGWKNIPNSDVINSFVKDLKNIIQDKKLYQLVFYKKSGKDKGARDHKEFFATKEEADARYKEVFEKNSEFNPTVWIKTKFEYKRLSGY